MKRPRLWQYLISFIVGAAIALGVFSAKDFFSETDTAQIYKTLSDGFFVAGVLLSGVGLLVFASNGGAFDMLVYGVQSAFSLILPAARRHDTFYDYRVSRQKNRPSYAFMLLTGLFYIALAVIFSLVFSKFYQG